jgi:hypothetical protein
MFPASIIRTHSSWIIGVTALNYARGMFAWSNGEFAPPRKSREEAGSAFGRRGSGTTFRESHARFDEFVFQTLRHPGGASVTFAAAPAR